MFVRHPDGRIEPTLDLSLVAALVDEMPVAEAMQTLADFERAECFTAYGMRDGRIFFVDPLGIAREPTLEAAA